MNKVSVQAQTKVWGETSKVAAAPGFQVHYLKIKAGTYCSRHYHENKWNIFYVTRGAVSVRTYPGPKPGVKIEELIELRLRAGQSTVVPPHVWHRFVAHEDSEMIEVYMVPDVREDDIQRADVGGVIEPGGTAP